MDMIFDWEKVGEFLPFCSVPVAVGASSFQVVSSEGFVGCYVTIKLLILGTFVVFTMLWPGV